MAARWTFYTGRGTCALATHIALCEAGAAYDIVHLDFAAQQQRSPEYLAINPKGRVPALATERGVITETPALLQFVAQSFPAARLAPLDDAFALAQLQAFNGWLSSTVHVSHAHKRRGARWTDDPAAQAALQARVPHTMAVHAAEMEQQIRGPWVLGEQYSVADGYLYTLTSWLEDDGVDLAPRARLREHSARVAARPAVQRALAEAAG